MRARDIWAVVPVKRFALCKQRLKPLLSDAGRENLARAMLEDVLDALGRAACLAGVLVVTADRLAAAMARRAGAHMLADADEAGISAAVAAAATSLATSGRQGMAVIPADVPLITPPDVEAMVSAHCDAPSVTLVPAACDGGTNALICSPPLAIPFSFGEDSCARHQRAARAAGIEPQVLPLERLARDLDRPDDLVHFLRMPSGTRTHACLAGIGLHGHLPRVQERERRGPQAVRQA
jgi:2-phospho-L-lactate guanylyltransferase